LGRPHPYGSLKRGDGIALEISKTCINYDTRLTLLLSYLLYLFKTL
jgi:hypothetical protein